MRRRGELKLVEQAVRNNWDMTPIGRRDAMELVRDVLADADASDRERIRACRIAVLMEQRNQWADEDEALFAQVVELGNEIEQQLRGVVS